MGKAEGTTFERVGLTANTRLRFVRTKHKFNQFFVVSPAKLRLYSGFQLNENGPERRSPVGLVHSDP